jgi:hypothetical protein
MPPFVKGKPRHANAGRRAGTPNKATAAQQARQAQALSDDAEIIRKVVEESKAGDPAARQIYFKYLKPLPQRYLGPFAYEAPKDVGGARAKLLELGERLAEGKMPAELHDSLVNGLKAYLSDKAAEQQRKLDELEEALRASGSDPP